MVWLQPYFWKLHGKLENSLQTRVYYTDHCTICFGHTMQRCTMYIPYKRIRRQNDVHSGPHLCFGSSLLVRSYSILTITSRRSFPLLQNPILFLRDLDIFSCSQCCGSGSIWTGSDLPTLNRIRIWMCKTIVGNIFRKAPWAKIVVLRKAWFKVFNSSDKIYVVRHFFKLTVVKNRSDPDPVWNENSGSDQTGPDPTASGSTTLPLAQNFIFIVNFSMKVCTIIVVNFRNFKKLLPTVIFESEQC